MKFIVTVVDANSGEYVVDIKEGNVGLNEIDQVRRDLSMWIDIDKFRPAISSFYSKTISFELSEKEARATVYFSTPLQSKNNVMSISRGLLKLNQN